MSRLLHSCSHPDGNCSCGIFHKESRPLEIREDLFFNESIVCELIFGHKDILFTVLYRNPHIRANSDDFMLLLGNFNRLYEQIKSLKSYAMFFTGDFNAYSQTWYLRGTRVFRVLNLIICFQT